MNKKPLIKAIIQQLQTQLKTAKSALKMAADTATHKETVAENKYDTFGLEASYLAHGQQQRVADTLLAIQRFEDLQYRCKQSHEEVGIASLVKIENDNNEQQYFFIAEDAGGLKIDWQEKHITVISADAPLCKQMLGKSVDDDVLHQQQNYFIAELY